VLVIACYYEHWPEFGLRLWYMLYKIVYIKNN